MTCKHCDQPLSAHDGGDELGPHLSAMAAEEVMGMRMKQWRSTGGGVRSAWFCGRVDSPITYVVGASMLDDNPPQLHPHCDIAAAFEVGTAIYMMGTEMAMRYGVALVDVVIGEKFAAEMPPAFLITAGARAEPYEHCIAALRAVRAARKDTTDG